MADANIIVIGGNADDQDHDIPGNTNPAWRVHQGSEDYIAISTVTGSEAILLATGTGIDDFVGCKVGISITEPQEKLHVAAQDGNQAYIKFTNDDTQHADGDGCYVGLNSDESMRVWQKEANVLDFGTSGVFAMRIDADGDVGIGATDPGATLHVRDSGADIANFQSTGGATHSTVTIRADGSGDPKVQFNLGIDALWSMGLHNAGGDNFKIASGTNLGSNTRFTIDSGGLIGIGNTGSSPSTLLTMGENKFVNATIANGYAACITLDPSYYAESASSTFEVTKSHYIRMDNPTTTSHVSQDLTVESAMCFTLDAALGTHKATTNSDKSSGTASGTLKVEVNGTLYHIQLYADS